MSNYGLIKATNQIMRSDTIHDLYIVNEWRRNKGLLPFISPKPSVRQLENTVALAIYGLDINDLPKLLRGIEQYISFLEDMKLKEKQTILNLNSRKSK